MNFVYKVKKNLYWLFLFYKNIKSNNIKSSYRDMFLSCKYGFFLETYNLLQIDNNNRTNYVSDKWYKFSHPLNGKFSAIIDNKLYLPYLLKDFEEYVPRYYYYIENGRLIDLRGGARSRNF